MRQEAAKRDLFDWAKSQNALQDAPGLDRSSPETLDALDQILSRPLPIAHVERLEAWAKSLWLDVLEPGSRPTKTDSAQFTDFFHRLGFLFKYKPYGVKIASPFGYSIFDLKEGQGFSFQIHEEPKLEAFHILAAKPQSFVYISSLAEWEEEGREWAARATSGAVGLPDPAFVLRPRAGDVIEINQTQVVHAVLGCVIEEYASCSVDAVLRLLDQNARSIVELPPRHPDVQEILAGCRPGLPVRRVERVAQGWRATGLSATEPMIRVEHAISGGRRLLAAGEATAIEPVENQVSLVVALEGSLRFVVEGRTWQIHAGGMGCVLPGREATVTAEARRASVAIHRVTRDLVARDWI